MNYRRTLIAAAMVGTVITTSPAQATSSADDPSERTDTLDEIESKLPADQLDEQLLPKRVRVLLAAPKKKESFVVEGRIEGASAGYVVANVEPMMSDLGAVKPGDPLGIEPVAAAAINDDGTYRVEIDVSHRKDGRRLLIEVLDMKGRAIGAEFVNLATRRDEAPASRSSSTRSTSLALDIPVESPGVAAAVTVESSGELSNGGYVDAEGRTSASRSSEFNSPFGPVRPPSRPDVVGPYNSACEWFNAGYDYPWVVVATGGTNTRHADVSASFTNGFRSTLGCGVQFGGSNWSLRTGVNVVAGTTATSTFAPSNRYGLDTFEIAARYRRGLRWCWQYTGTYNQHTVRLDASAVYPEEFVGGSRRQQWFGQSQYFPTYCLERAQGEFILDQTEAREYPSGVNLGFLRLSAQTNYSTRSELTWDSDRPNKFICGESNFPGDTRREAGKIMADYRDRN